MSNDGKVKFYKNPARKAGETLKPYVPQYQQMGVSPEEYKSPLSPGYNLGKVVVAKPSMVNPRSPRPIMQQPYAESINSPIGRGRGLIPNVGNNMEQTWSSVDGELVDDISGVDPDHTMIDNNDFVSTTAFGESELVSFPEQPKPVPEPPKTFLSGNELQNALKNEYLTTLAQQLDKDEYLILVFGEPICSGSSSFVQEQTRDLVFGEHELYPNNPVSTDDIVILKRVEIKVGVFLG